MSHSTRMQVRDKHFAVNSLLHLIGPLSLSCFFYCTVHSRLGGYEFLADSTISLFDLTMMLLDPPPISPQEYWYYRCMPPLLFKYLNKTQVIKFAQNVHLYTDLSPKLYNSFFKLLRNFIQSTHLIYVYTMCIIHM